MYAGHFDLPDAAAVVGQIDNVGEIVRSLAREALIHVERSGASRLHFRLLRTVRDLALEGLEPAELAATQALHRRWYAGRWRRASVDLVQDVRENFDDYPEALRTALDSQDATTLADLTLTLTQFWQFTGGQAVGLRWIGRVLDSDVLGAGERARVLAQRAALALHHDHAIVLADTEAAIPVLEAQGDLPPAVTALSAPSRYLLTRGWDLLGAGSNPAALESFAGSVPDVPHVVDRQNVESLLGAGCTLAALGHPTAVTALAGALELVSRVDFPTPPALGRAIDRARRQVEHEPWPDLTGERTATLLDRLEVNLAAVVAESPSAQGRSAAG